MDRLNDAELQAVVAHELGHLLTDGHLTAVATLNGCCTDTDCEVRADAAGARLMQARRISPAAMITMLQKVERYGALSPGCAAAVERRIAVLTAAENAN
jgi:Zn-dependent protease with chaperone function